MKLLPITEKVTGDTVVGYLLECPAPGCGGHVVHIHPYKNRIGASWSFNGNLEKPTFNPSLLTRIEFTDGKVFVCHSFVRNGMIQFLSDCTHELAGQTVEIPNIDA